MLVFILVPSAVVLASSLIFFISMILYSVVIYVFDSTSFSCNLKFFLFLFKSFQAKTVNLNAHPPTFNFESTALSYLKLIY